MGFFFVIFLKLSTVWHNGLLFKLQQNGINGCLLIWMQCYPSNRQQTVIIGTAKSKLMNVKAGHPQGSVLGPLLFFIYDNISENKAVAGYI